MVFVMQESERSLGTILLSAKMDINTLYPARSKEPVHPAGNRRLQAVRENALECLPDNGALNLAKSNIPSDICVDGMALNYLSYFCPENKGIKKLLNFLLEHQKEDGGFTWHHDKTTGDPHTTICVLEGFHQYICSGNMYRLEDVLRASESALGYLLENNLFMDANDKRFRMLAYPFRYHYSVFRALCYCTTAQIGYDVRMKPAIQWLTDKKGIDGKWQLEYTYPGKVHFEMEKLHNPSRFITQKALVIFDRYSKPCGLVTHFACFLLFRHALPWNVILNINFGVAFFTSFFRYL